MLKNDIEKTLQAHKPDPSEGFAEMIDDKVFRLMAERQEQKAARKKKRLRLLPVTAAALVVVMSVGILAANGHFGLINRPDEIRPGEGRYTAQPIETVLAQGTVTVPGETDGTETSPVLAEVDKNDALDRGSTFILYWNGENGWNDADLQAMLDLCTPEWKEKAGDANKAREALKEILGNTSYHGMLGNIWVSGESGDPVRTLIMRGYGKWAQTQISYDMKLEADGLWYIDPESIQITSPDESKRSLAEMKPEDLDAELEYQWPGIAEKLIPMNLSCESQGFRVEMISGLVKERESWIVYSVQDLETDRGYDRDIDRYWPYIEMDIGHQTEQLNGLIIGYDKDERREFIIAHQQYAEPINPENRNITFKIKDISIFGRKDTDLTPLIEQYGKTVDGIESPELIPDETIEKKRNVLDFHNPLDIPIDEGIVLTGIGWIDYELHVQVHYTKTENDDSTMYFHMCNSYPWGAEGYDADFTGEMWTEDSGQGENWQAEVWYEYFSPLKRKDVEYVKPVLEITKRLEKVEVDREIQILLNQIMTGGCRDAAEPAENNPDQTAEAPEGTGSAYDAYDTKDLHEKMESKWPEIREELIPVNLSCEKQGIRVELLSALVQDREAWVMYSVQDLDGDRISGRSMEQYRPYAVTAISQNMDMMSGTVFTEYDETTHKMTVAEYVLYDQPVEAYNGPVTFGIKNITISGHTDTDLTPLIEQYGKTAEGIEPPEMLFTEPTDLKRKVLDSHDPLDIPIDEGVVLTGIGVIDNELHIQLHYPDNRWIWFADNTRYRRKIVSYVSYSFENREHDIYEHFMSACWDENGDNVEDREEFISRLKQEDADKAATMLCVERVLESIEDNWEFQIPLNSIRKEGNRFEQDGLVFSLEEDDSVMVVSDPSYQERKEITIPEIAMLYVREIGEDAFKDCRELNSVTIPDYVSEIRDHAFSGCENLASLILPKKLETVGEGAFEGCKALTSVALPDNVMTIGGSAFRGCSSLASVSIPNGADFDGGSVFADCTSLVSVTLPRRMENLGDYMFSGCESLEQVIIQEGTRTIGIGAFRNCGKLKIIEIPYSVYYISDHAFENCGNLAKIEIPEIVSYIGKNAFTGCENMVCVVYEGSYAQQYCEENGIQYEIRQAE